MPVSHFFFTDYYYLLQTQHFNFFFEKYYTAHIGTKLAYKTSVSPHCCGDSQAEAYRGNIIIQLTPYFQYSPFHIMVQTGGTKITKANENKLRQLTNPFTQSSHPKTSLLFCTVTQLQRRIKAVRNQCLEKCMTLISNV